MTEQMFLKEFGKMPENVKQELLAFFDFLVNKHKLQLTTQVEGQNNGAGNQGTAPKAGFLKGTFTMAEDFDAPLEDFKEYMK